MYEIRYPLVRIQKTCPLVATCNRTAIALKQQFVGTHLLSFLDRSYGATSYFCIANISPVHIVGVCHTIAKSARMRRSANSENNRGENKIY